MTRKKISRKFIRTGNYRKLSGLTVVGRIDLPAEEKKKSSPYQPVKVDRSDSDFRRKKRRKRITKRSRISCSC
jgi:hypothetical protein